MGKTQLTDTASPQDTGQEIQRISDRIVKLCETALAQGRPYLLSQLGLDLGKDVQTLKILTGKKLREFIRDYEPLRKCYRVAPVEGRQNAFAIVRNEGEASNEGETPAVQAQPVEIEPHPEPKYHYRFWAAFAVPSDGKRRFFDPNQLVFKNLSEGVDLPINWIPIEDEFVAPAEIEHRDEIIKENIDKWLTRHKVDKSRFLHHARPVEMSAQSSLLLSVIEALDRKQLQSTSLTLDVVAALLGKKH